MSYTPSDERVVSRTIRETQPVCSENFRHFPITSCSREKRYQALHAFLYCKRWKAGRGLGTRLHKNGRGPGIIYHVSYTEGREKLIEGRRIIDVPAYVVA